MAKIERLENVVYHLCKAAVDNDASWGAWADPLHEFIKEIKEERVEQQNEGSLEVHHIKTRRK